MIENFFKFPGSHRIVSKEGLRGVTPVTQFRKPFLEFHYEHTYMRVYFENNDQMFEYYEILKKELGVKVIKKC
jgi:hypothetical protein